MLQRGTNRIDGPTHNDDVMIDNVVQLYNARIGAALDQLSLDDIRLLVAEIEAKILACDCEIKGIAATRRLRTEI